MVSAKLQGITMSPQEPEVFKRFIDILDYRPSFAAMAVHLPLGLPGERLKGGRECDREARRLVRWPRAAAIASPPSYAAVDAWRRGGPDRRGLSAVTQSLMPRIAEVYQHLGSYHQRTLFEVHPELSFFQLNGDRPLLYSKHTDAGKQERQHLLISKIPGVERILQARTGSFRYHHLLDGCADLWTARRVLARAVTRLPDKPEWDDLGIRMEIVR